MKQRAIMVVSTILNPELIIADEITSALDVSSQRFAASLLVQLRDEGIIGSAIFITHDLAILYQIADSADHVRRAHVKPAQDTIVHEPRHPYAGSAQLCPRWGYRSRTSGWRASRARRRALRLARFRERCPYRTRRPSRPCDRAITPEHTIAWHREIEGRLAEHEDPIMSVEQVTKIFSRECSSHLHHPVRTFPSRCIPAPCYLIGESGSGKTTMGRMILSCSAPPGRSASTAGTSPPSGEGGAPGVLPPGRDRDPFSSFNPLPVDRVFDQIYDVFFPEAPRSAAPHQGGPAQVHLHPGDPGPFPSAQRRPFAGAPWPGALAGCGILVADELISMLTLNYGHPQPPGGSAGPQACLCCLSPDLALSLHQRLP